MISAAQASGVLVQELPPALMEQPVPAYLREGIVRRQLGEIQNQITQSGLTDEMTLQIEDWSVRFKKDLDLRGNEEESCQLYIAELQKMLIDPFSHAPLDAGSLLGSDGHTYGQMSLDVYRLRFPLPYRNRSPLDMKNPAPLEVAAHPVVQHMIGWLESHNALLYSPELEKIYHRLQPQAQKMDRAARIERIRARRAASIQKEAEERNAQVLAFEKETDVRFQALEQQVEQKLKELDVRFGAVQKRLDDQAAQDQKDVEKVGAGIEKSAEPLHGAQAALNAVAQNEGLALEHLRTRVEKLLRAGFDPIADRIKTFENGGAAEIKQAADADQKILTGFKDEVGQIRKTINGLQTQNLELETAQSNVGGQINDARRQRATLQQSVNELRIAIEQKKERDHQSLWQSVALVGVGILATWAACSLLAPSSARVLVTPTSQQGVRFTAFYKF